MKHLNLEKRQRNLLAIGSAIVLLGVGNIIYGQFKTAQYIEVLEKSNNISANSSEPADLSTLNLSEKYRSQSSYSEQIEKVRTRIDFYELAVTGGKFMLVIGGISLLSGLFPINHTASNTNK